MRNPKMQQVQHPTFEGRVIRTSGGLEQRAVEDRNRVRLRFQSLAEGHFESAGTLSAAVSACSGSIERYVRGATWVVGRRQTSLRTTGVPL